MCLSEDVWIVLKLYSPGGQSIATSGYIHLNLTKIMLNEI